MEEGGGQREAELNDLRDAASPQEAKRPSVILHTPTGSAPAFGFFLIPRVSPPVCGPRFTSPHVLVRSAINHFR